MKYKANKTCETCLRGVFTWHDQWWSCDGCGMIDRILTNPMHLDEIWVRFCECDINSIIRLGRIGHRLNCPEYDQPVPVMGEDGNDE